MRRFHYNDNRGDNMPKYDDYENEDDDLDNDDWNEDEEEDYEEDVILNSGDVLNVMNISMIKYMNNIRLLEVVVGMLEKKLFWRFLSFKKKINITIEAYNIFQKLLSKEE